MMKRILLVVALGAVLAMTFGCHRYIDSTNPVRSLPTAPSTPINVVAQLNSQSVTLSWEVADSAGVSRFRVYVADSAGTNYVLRDSTTTYSQTVSGLTVNKLYNFEVATVGSDGIEGNRSTPISVRIGLMAVTIENGNPYINHRDVTLQLVAPSTATYVYLSEDSTFTGTPPVSFFPTRTFTLSPNDGLKTVYARFVFSDGSHSGTPVSDEITLDTRAKIDSVYFTSPATPPYKAGDVITFVLSAGETGGVATAGIAGGGTPIALYDDASNGDAVSGDGIYSARFTVPINVQVTNANVTGNFTDAAGNSAAPVAASKTITISNPPLPVQITSIEATSPYSVSLTWSQASAAGFASYKVYRGTTATVTTASTLVKTLANVGGTSYSDTSVAQNTKYYYRIYTFNDAGLSTPSNVDSAKTLVDNPPDPVVLAGTFRDSTNAAQLSWSQSLASDFAYYELFRSLSPQVQTDTSTQKIAVINNASGNTFTDPLPDTTKTYYYQVMTLDKHGLSSLSNVVLIKKP